MSCACFTLTTVLLRSLTHVTCISFSLHRVTQIHSMMSHSNIVHFKVGAVQLNSAKRHSREGDLPVRKAARSALQCDLQHEQPRSGLLTSP